MSNAHPMSSLAVPGDQPLIGLFLRENGREVVRYFADEEQAEAAVPDDAVQDALNLAGAWSDLDWDEMEAELYRIGHSTPPTPPLEDTDV